MSRPYTRKAIEPRFDSPNDSTGLSEPQSHTEHQAALAATLFRAAGDPDELVLELDQGELRLQGSMTEG